MLKPKRRHYFIVNLVRPFVTFFFKHKYGYQVHHYYELKKEPFLLLSNHVTQVDPILVSLSFKQHIYYVTTENVFRRKLISKLLVFWFAPIRKTKNEIDLSTIRNMMELARNGGSVGLFLSGNATYSGTEEYIHSPIAKLVRMLGLPVVIYNLNGCYGVAPRWGKELRKGECYGSVKRIITKEEYAKMSDTELEDVIHAGLHVKATDGVTNANYDCKDRAEYLERALFLCPNCHSLHTMVSNGNNFKCSKCGYEVVYEPNLTFTTLKGEPRFTDVKAWYDYEKKYVAEFDFSTYNESVILADSEVTVRDIYDESDEGFAGSLQLYQDRIEVQGTDHKLIVFFKDITSMAAQSKNNLLFKTNGAYYEINGNPRRSALAYLFIYYSIRNKKEGVKDGFLGI